MTHDEARMVVVAGIGLMRKGGQKWRIIEIAWIRGHGLFLHLSFSHIFTSVVLDRYRLQTKDYEKKVLATTRILSSPESTTVFSPGMKKDYF